MTKKLPFILFFLHLYCLVSAQQINDRVQFKGTDGKTYTGSIVETNGNKYKVKYEGYDFNARMVKEQFQVVGAVAARGVTEDKGNDEAMVSHEWKVGDKVQVQDMYNNNVWENATITEARLDWNPVRYKASLDDPANHAITSLLLVSREIRGRNVFAKNFSLNSRVDAYYGDGTPKGRATVIEIKGSGRYKVHYDGCAAYRDEEVDWSQLKSASTISGTHPDVTATFGK